jgi:hypothetical protein
VLGPKARIQHLYTYSPLEPWQDHFGATLGHRVFCHALIDRAPDELIDEILSEVSRLIAQGQLALSEDDPVPSSIGPRTARMLRALVSARSSSGPAHGGRDEEADLP